jgi:mycofactocin system glycosyltransferase
VPAGWRVVLDPGVRRLDGGTVLIGGSPLRLLRLSPGGAALVARLAAGDPVPAAPAAHRLVRSLLAAGLAHPRPLAPPPPGPGVAVVVPTHDRAGALATTLAGVATWRGAGNTPVEVMVVDDASADAAGTARAAALAGATLLRHAANRGPAAARNTGWRATTAELVAFVDADCEPAPGWLDPLVAHLDDPTVALAAPRIAALPTPSAPRWLAAYDAHRSPLDLGPTEAAIRPRSRVPYVPGTALLVRRAALEAAGGFDEALRVGEDVDLVWRLVAAGWSARYDPGAVVGHPVRGNACAWLGQRFDYGSSAAPLAARHGRTVAPLVESRCSLAAWALAGLGLPGPAAALAMSSAVTLGVQVRGRGRHPRTAHPWREAGRIAGGGTLRAGAGVAHAVRRAWWPLAVPAAALSRRGRRAAALVLLAPPLLEWLADRPAGLGPLRWTALRLADDAAYGAGVWVGAGRHRSIAALRPDLR